MKETKDIIVLGYGNIGSLETKILSKKYTPVIYDPKLQDRSCLDLLNKIKYDLAVICVPTPTDYTEGVAIQNKQYVIDAITEVDAEVYLIKSTVLPGTTDLLKEKFNKRIVMSPEHSGTTQHCTNFDYDFTILGGDLADCQYIQQIYQEVFDAYHKFMIVPAKVAELSKYMLNSYLATKVTFCNEFAKIAKELNISYEQLRECFILDPRIEASHTYVYDEHPYWDSHCFNKDLPAIADNFNSDLLKKVVEINNKAKN